MVLDSWLSRALSSSRFIDGLKEAVAISESLKKPCSKESAVDSAKDWSMDYLGHSEAFFFKDWLTDSCLGTILEG